MAALGNAVDRRALLRRMGAELANVHCRGDSTEEVRDHVQRLTANTLAACASAMKELILRDYASHRKARHN
jgi:hypothetical protein